MSRHDERTTDDRPDEETPSIAIYEVGGDATGVNTGLKPGEEPIVPRDAAGEPLGDDHAVPDEPLRRGHIDTATGDRALGGPAQE